ncbi:hypothetical protein GJ496_007945, partial [Pomphorhynchus laevis]
IDVCKDNIEWAECEQRSFLRQTLQVRLIALYHEKAMFDDALDLTSKLLRELKKIDDKHLIVDVQLLESQIFYSLGNIARSRASLTSARTTANSIYCPPKLQASLDLQSGIMHAAESDFKTAYSYFYEAFDGYDSTDDKRAVLALKYMLLCKIMLQGNEDMRSILSAKITLKYAGPEIESMKAISDASKARSLAQFEQVVSQYKNQLSDDEVVNMQLNTLYDTLFDKNLSKLIEPFSRVEISYIAKMINRSQSEVEKKLSMMILDKRLNGILNQNTGILILFDDQKTSKLYPEAISVVTDLDKVIDVLFTRAQIELVLVFANILTLLTPMLSKNKKMHLHVLLS